MRLTPFGAPEFPRMHAQRRQTPLPKDFIFGKKDVLFVLLWIMFGWIFFGY